MPPFSMPICQGNQSPGGSPGAPSSLTSSSCFWQTMTLGSSLSFPAHFSSRERLRMRLSHQLPAGAGASFFSCKLPGTSAAPGMNTFYFEGGR